MVREYSSNSKRVALFWLKVQMHKFCQLNLTLKRFPTAQCALSLFLCGLIGVWIVQSKHVCFPFSLHEAGITPKDSNQFVEYPKIIALLPSRKKNAISSQRFINFYSAKQVANVKIWANQGQIWNKNLIIDDGYKRDGGAMRATEKNWWI